MKAKRAAGRPGRGKSVPKKVRLPRRGGGSSKRKPSELELVRKAAGAERKRFYEVLDTLPAYLILLTPDHHIQYMNRFFRERFGDSGGRKCFEYLFHLEAPCENCKTYDALKNMAPLEWEWTGPDGRNYYIYDFPFKEADGPTLILEVGLDITVQKLAQEELRQAGSYNRSLIEVSLDPLVTIGADGRITDVNHATEAATGHERARLVGTDFAEYFTDPEKARRGYRRAFEEGSVRDYPLDIRHRDGRVTPVLYNASVFKDERGDIRGVFAAARDISEQRRAENEVSRHREHLEQLVEERTAELERRRSELDAILASMAEPVIVYDEHRVPVRANAAAREQLGVEARPGPPPGPGGSRGRDPAGGQAVAMLAAVSRALQGETVRSIEFASKGPDGATRTFLGSSAPIAGPGRVTGAVSALHDITDLKEADRAMQQIVSELATVTAEALRRADELDTLLATIATPVMLFDNDGDPVRVNPAAEAYFGFDPTGLTGTELLERLDVRLKPGAAGRPDLGFPSALRGEHVRDAQYDLRCGTGDRRTVFSSCSPLVSSGRIAGAVCSLHDITGHRRAEQALAESEEKYRLLFQTMVTGFALHEIICDRDGKPVDYRFLELNPAFERLTGLKASEAVGRTVREIIPDIEQDWIDIYGEVALTGKSARFERYAAPLDRHFEVAAYRPKPGQFAVTFTDITERKKAERAAERTLADVRRREAEVSALLAGSKHILETQDFAVSARKIFDSCLGLIGAASGYVALLSDDGARNEVLFLESGGLPCTVDPSLPMPIRGLRAEAYRTGRPVYDNAFAASEHALLLPGGHVTLENVMFAPMVLEGRAVGLLGLANKPGGFTDGDARLAAAFGEMAAIALRNSRNLEALKKAERASRGSADGPARPPRS